MSRKAGFTTHMTRPIDFAKLEVMIRQVAPKPALEGQETVALSKASQISNTSCGS